MGIEIVSLGPVSMFEAERRTALVECDLEMELTGLLPGARDVVPDNLFLRFKCDDALVTGLRTKVKPGDGGGLLARLRARPPIGETLLRTESFVDCGRGASITTRCLMVFITAFLLLMKRLTNWVKKGLRDRFDEMRQALQRLCPIEEVSVAGSTVGKAFVEQVKHDALRRQCIESQRHKSDCPLIFAAYTPLVVQDPGEYQSVVAGDVDIFPEVFNNDALRRLDDNAVLATYFDRGAAFDDTKAFGPEPVVQHFRTRPCVEQPFRGGGKLALKVDRVDGGMGCRLAHDSVSSRSR